jgi:hypothetical protein
MLANLPQILGYTYIQPDAVESTPKQHLYLLYRYNNYDCLVVIVFFEDAIQESDSDPVYDNDKNCPLLWLIFWVVCGMLTTVVWFALYPKNYGEMLDI